MAEVADAIEVVPDARLAGVLDNVARTVEALTIDGKRLFPDDVLEVEDIEEFLLRADPLRPEAAAGLIGYATERFMAEDNGAEYCMRLPLEIAFRFHMDRAPGAGEEKALRKAHELADVIRKGLLVDRYRGGQCSAVQAGGRLIDGTSVDGEARLAARTAGGSFYAGTVQIELAWRTPAA
jgi:hypothetical protein